ncbi:hypothetical protein A4S06_11305 [Erysipelotrichaceae bacterium MTC7]|nr:hypothetical protein A4S06_11305 [Erysipelotrichaceae bacterium MTC7]
MKHTEYGRIDYFRIVAALLVIAAHYPVFQSLDPTLDYAYTRIIARIAVPFFFISSAFFLFKHIDSQTSSRVHQFMKTNIKYYILCIIIYLPFNFIGGSYANWTNIKTLLQQFLFNGTFYHLWFFVGSAVGAWIAWLFLKTFNIKSSLFFTTLLYLIGMFGDSYYGLIKNIPVLAGFYDIIFQVFDTTRNGLFMAPVFFVLGALLAKQSRQHKIKASYFDILICFVTFVTEGLLVYKLQWIRSDINNTMYLSLLPFSYCLFRFLIAKTKPRNVQLRNISLYMYILHPMIIIGMQKVLRFSFMQNTLIFYIILCLLTFLISYGLARITKFNQLVSKITS